MGSSSSAAAMAMAFLLPFLIAISLVDSKPLASILPLLRHIDSINPQGPHFTIEAIKQYGGLFNSASYQLWPQDSPSSFSPSPSSFSPTPSSFSSFPPSSPSAPSFPSPFNASPSFFSSSPSYLASPQTTFESAASENAGINFAQQEQVHPLPRIRNSGEVKKFPNNADNDEKLISKSLVEPNLKFPESKSDRKPPKSEKHSRKSESDPKASSKKELSLYDALRSRADMVKSENAASKSASLLKSLGSRQSLEEFPTKTEEMDFAVESFSVGGNSLEEFPVSFHPEEELARRG